MAAAQLNASHLLVPGVVLVCPFNNAIAREALAERLGLLLFKPPLRARNSPHFARGSNAFQVLAQILLVCVAEVGPCIPVPTLLPVSEDGVSATSTFNGHFSRSILMEHLSEGFIS